MRRKLKVSVAAALAASLLMMPSGLLAKEKRGADLVVTRTDGSLVEGELIAVKPDSLLLLSTRGRDESVELTDIRSVRVVRRSRAGRFGLIFGGAGLVAGALMGSSAYDDDSLFTNPWQSTAILGGILGGIGALSGLVVGSFAGIDSTFSLKGKLPGVVADYWDDLHAYSRVGRRPDLPPPPRPRPAPAEEPELARQRTPPVGLHGPAHQPYFKISLASTLPSSGSSFIGGAGAFVLPELPPAEAGPHDVQFDGTNGYMTNRVAFGPVSLSYAWKARWAAEIEFFTNARMLGYVSGYLGYVSGLDGKTYEAMVSYNYITRCNGFLAGLAYRPLTSTALKRHSLEIGCAVGPAWFTATASEEGPLALPPLRKLVPAARVQVSYEYSIISALSVGAVVGYRYMKGDVSGITGAGRLTFRDTSVPGPGNTERLVDVALPPFRVDASGRYWGFRIGVRL